MCVYACLYVCLSEKVKKKRARENEREKAWQTVAWILFVQYENTLLQFKERQIVVVKSNVSTHWSIKTIIQERLVADINPV